MTTKNKLSYMKTLILFLFVSTSVFGQCKYEKNEIDEFTGAIKKQTKWEKIAPGVMVMIIQHETVIGIMLYANLGCVSSSDSKAYFKFTDGEVVTLNHVGEINCNETVGLILNIGDNLKSFTTKSLAKIRLVGDRVMDVEVNKPTYLGNTLNSCFDLSAF